MTDLPFISIVVIGYNEGKNLEATFEAIKYCNYPLEKLELLYCDTGSSDNSTDIAKRFTSKVFIEQSRWPTAGLARNLGLTKSSHDLIHFIDGDIQIDKDYLNHAVNRLRDNNIHAVFGAITEESSKRINKVLISHWSSRTEGYCEATGGGGTYKRKPLLDINGYDDRIKRGQETEMGLRFIEAGYNIYFIPFSMGVHKYNVNNILDFLHRQIREGVNYTHLSLYKGDNKFFENAKKLARNNIITHIIIIGVIMFAFLLNKPFVAFITLVVYPLYLMVKYLGFKKIHNYDQLLYALITNLSRSWVLYGQLKGIFIYLTLSKKDRLEFKSKRNNSHDNNLS